MNSDASVGSGQSLLLVVSDYTVLDIETTGFSYRDSIIELSAIKYRNDTAVSSFSSLLKPSAELSGFITRLTGISNEMLVDKPGIKKVLPDFINFIGNDILLGHNVSFDISRINNACENLGLPTLSNDYVDTMRIAKRLYPDLGHYTLWCLSSYLDIHATTYHRALADCETTAECYKRMKNDDGFSGMYTQCCNPKTNQYKHKPPRKTSAVVCTVDSIDQTNPLYGKSIVFTGALSVSRETAMQAAVNAGAVLRKSVSRCTDYLVVGEQDIEIVGVDGLSTKQEKAYALINSGEADIKIISETEFFALINAEADK